MMRFMSCLLIAGTGGLSFAQDVPETIKLTVPANGAPVPALKYSLVPLPSEISTGNGALDYYRAFSPELWTGIHRQPVKYWEDIQKFQTAPLAEINAQVLRNFPIRGSILRMVERGARREYCDWELAPRVAEGGATTLLPDVQGIRNLASCLALQARLDLAEGKIDACLHTLQTGLILSKQIAESHSLITHLVGVSCMSMMTRQLEELMQHPQAPNLYWAIAQLPQPYFDLRKPLAGERLMFDREFAALRDLEKGLVPPEAARKVLDGMIERLNFSQQNVDRKELDAEILAMLPSARQALIRAGRVPVEVIKMPPVQAALLHIRAESNRLRDDVMKWMLLPYVEGREGMRRAGDAHRASAGKLKVLSIFSEFHSSAEKAVMLRMRIDRKLAALRTVEAIKLHVADKGAFPKSLEEVSAAPIPLDPMVGKPFEYALEGQSAILTAPLHGLPKGNGWRYEITLRK